MQLSRGRTPLDSFYDSIGPSTPQLLDQDPPSSDLFAFGASGKDPLSGYPSLAHLSTSTISDPSSSSSGSFVLGADGSPPPPSPHGYSFLNFKYGCNPIFSGSSILSFEQSVPQGHQFEDYSAFADAFEHVDQNGQINVKCGFGSNGLSYLDSSNRSSVCISKEIDGDDQFGWIYSDTSATVEHRLLNQGSDRSLEGSSHKRSYTGGEMQPSKKHCGGNQKKPKSTKPSASKDPQSIAAKNRRERISERLKILQDLVPNGTKVDLVTMLEKAISYVKFLQLQVKVLSTDELWPSQGGKAPEISQVRDVIDSILSSHRERTSGSM